MISEETRALRSTGIGGSDIGVLMGMSRFKTPYDIYLEKTGQKIDIVKNPRVRWGNILEAVVAKEYAAVTCQKVQRINQMLRHPLFEYVIGNIDRAVVNPDIKGNVRWKDGRLTTDRILECKTADKFTMKLWGEEGTDYVPDAYVAQVQWYMLLTGCKYADLAVLIGGSDFRIYHIDRDEDLQEMMLQTAYEFWQGVKEGRPPEPLTAAEALSRWQKATPDKTVELDETYVADIRRLIAIADTRKDLKDEEDAIKARIMGAMGDVEEATHNGFTACTWKNTNGSRFDVTAFKIAHPELYKEFSTPSQGRRFILKGI